MVHGPTILAFFPPVNQKELERDIDMVAALDDFKFYSAKARDALQKLGIQLEEVYAPSFRITVSGKTTTFRPSRVRIGYYLIAPGKPPRIEYGVATDADLVQFARYYFGARSTPCSEAELGRAERESDKLLDWDAIHDWHKLYARCNDVDAAEGYSESVGRVLVDHWAMLPRLAEIARADAGFRASALSGINATLDMKDVETIRSKAISECPRRLRSLCDAIVKQAEIALKENDSTQKK